MKDVGRLDVEPLNRRRDGVPAEYPETSGVVGVPPVGEHAVAGASGQPGGDRVGHAVASDDAPGDTTGRSSKQARRGGDALVDVERDGKVVEDDVVTGERE